MGGQFEAGMGGAMSDGLRKGAAAAEADAQAAGDRVGATFGGKFADAFHSALDKGIKSLNEVEVRPDTSEATKALNDVDHAIAQIRDDMLELRDQHVGVNFDEQSAIRAMEDLRNRTRDLLAGQSGTLNPEQFTNLMGLDKQLAAFDKLVVEARRQGLLAGDAYGGALDQEITAAIDKALKELPKIKVGTDSSELTKTAAQLSAWIEELRRTKVGVDIDLPSFRAQLAAVTELFDEFAKQHADTPLGFNVGQAASTLNRLGETIDPEAVAAAKQAAQEAKQAAQEAAAAQKQAARDAAQAAKQAAQEAAAAERQAARDAAAAVKQAAQEKAAAEKQAARDAIQAARDAAAAEKQAARDAAQAMKDAAAVAKQAAADEAAQFAGAFNDKVTTGIDKSLRALQPVRITADSTDAELKVAAIRAQLEELSRTHMKLDDAFVVAQLTDIRNRLKEVTADAPNVRVKADSQAATAALGVVLDLEDKVDKRDPKAKVSADTSSASVNMKELASTFNLAEGQLLALIALGPGIGAALVPGIAAAAGALTIFGAAAAGAAVTAALGLSGIGTAVSALNTYQKQTAQSAASLATSQDRVTGALDQVSSAEASLANTRAQVAYGQRQAAQQVANAEEQVATAQRDALAAQQAITGAREEAQRSLEDQANQLKDVGIQQRQAVLDLQAAKTNLDAILTNPQSTQTEREQAQITYDQRSQQLKEVTLQQQRLQEDTAKAAKAGVEGSAQVVAAQDKVRTTTEAVAKAQQGLANAQASAQQQQRQGAFQIAQASQAVVNAQRAVESASTRAGVAGTTALTNLQAAMNNLSPAGQKFATFLFSLKPSLDSLRATAATTFLPGLQAGIAELLPVLPKINTGVGLLGTEMGVLSIRAGATLAAPYWTNFAQMLTGQALPAMDTAYNVLVNLGIGISGFAKAFIPFGESFGGAMLNLSQRFATFSTTLDSNQAFQHLLTFIRQNGSLAANTIGTIVTAIGHLVQGISPLGSPSLIILRALATVINAIPVGVLQTTAQAATLLGVAFKTWDILSTAKKSDIVKTAIGGLSTVVTGARVAMIDAQGTVGTFGTAIAGIKGAATTAASGIGDMLTAINPWAIALGAVALIIGVVVKGLSDQANREAEQKQVVDSLSSSLLSLADNYNGVSQASQDYLNSQVKSDANFRQLVIDAKNLGISVGTLSSALHGNKDALNSVNGSYDTQINQLKTFRDLTARSAGDVKLSAKDFADLSALRNKYGLLDQQTIQDLIDKYTAQKKAIDNTSASVLQQAEALGIVNAKGTDATDGTIRLQEAMDKMRDSTASASDKINALKDAEDGLAGTAKTTADAQRTFDAAAIQVTGALKTNKGAVDDATQAGHENIDALKGQVEASLGVYNAVLTQTGSVKEATDAYNAHIQKIYDEINASGLSRKEKDALTAKTKDLITTYGQIPPEIVTKMGLEGYDAVTAQLANIEIQQKAAREGIDLTAANKEWRDEHPDITGAHGGLATGGPVFGPGGPTDDMVNAWLSAGEHVWTAAEVQAAGGHAAVEQLRRWVLGGKSPQVKYPGDTSYGIAFADGGPVLKVDIANAWIPTLAQALAAVKAPTTFTGPVPADAASIQTWIRAQAGKPYIWDSAGPTGYDCSGALSAVWNLAHHLNPYRHTFSTFDEGHYFPKPGPGNFTAAWTNPGERGPGGTSVGHTAGSFYGLGFESRGGAGFVVGGGITPLREFAHIAHYDSGGMLPEGWSAVFNGTGGPEPVFNPEQWRAMQRALDRPTGGAGNTYNFAFRDTTLDPAKLRALQDREAALGRAGRAR